MAHRVTFEEALREHENQARRLGAAVLLLEQNHRELRNKEAELRNWSHLKRHEFFLQSIRRERKMILSDGLKLQGEKGLLEVELEKVRRDVELLLKRGKIVRL